MSSVILGITIGVLASVLIGIIGGEIYDLFYETWKEITCIVVTIALCIAITISITAGLCNYNKLQSTCYIKKYNVTKQTIEESIKSNAISGMERLQLVQNVIDENKYLEQQQFDCQQWYGFLIDKDVLELKPINFK